MNENHKLERVEEEDLDDEAMDRANGRVVFTLGCASSATKRVK